MNITKTAITRPVFIFVLMLATILMGIISYNGMRKEQNPDVSFGVVTVLSIYPGANPDSVATLVSRPIEEAVTGVNGVRDVISTSAEGRSVVTVQFEIGIDQDVALADVRAKVDAILNKLPTDVEKPTISRVDTSSTPVIYLALSSKTLSSRDLRTLVDDKLKDRFARITGVSEVGVIGGDIREIQVAVRKDQLLRYGVGLSDVQKAVAGSTVNIPAGRIVRGDSEFSVRVPGEFTHQRSKKAPGEIPARTDSRGQPQEDRRVRRRCRFMRRCVPLPHATRPAPGPRCRTARRAPARAAASGIPRPPSCVATDGSGLR
jgi:HAE1 family hydrophobic/amphiphilic exporter-1